MPTDAAVESLMDDTSPSEAAAARWVVERWADLCEAFPMQWIAVIDGTVVGRGTTAAEARREAEREQVLLGSGGSTERAHLFFVERSAERPLEH